MNEAILAAVVRLQKSEATPNAPQELKDAADKASSQPSISLGQWIWAGVVIGIGLAIAILLRRGIRGLTKQGSDNQAAVQITAQLVFLGTMLVAVYVALIVLGINLGPILAGAGIAGVVFGFALKDIAANYVSGVIIGFSHPFNPGDELVIESDDLEGTVESLELRYTVIRTYDGVQLMVPNALVLKSPIKNLTVNAKRRSEFLVRAALHEDMRHVIDVATSALKGVKDVDDDPAPSAYVEKVTDSWVHINVRFWHKSTREMKRLSLSQATIAVYEALSDAGIDTPYKQQDKPKSETS